MGLLRVRNTYVEDGAPLCVEVHPSGGSHDLISLQNFLLPTTAAGGRDCSVRFLQYTVKESPFRGSPHQHSIPGRYARGI